MPFCESKLFLDIQEEYLKKIKAYIEVGFKVVIYGAGVYGGNVFRMLKKYDIPVEKIVVTKLGYNKRNLDGKKIYELDTLVNEYGKYVYLLAIKPSAQYLLEKELKKRNIYDYITLPRYAEVIFDDIFFRPVLEITARIGCSINCHYCPQNLLLRQYYSDRSSQKEMSIEEFKTYVNKLPEDCIIDFSGFVEPFLAKDGVDMMKYAYESGHDIRLFTTLVGLTLEKFREIEHIPFKLVVLHLPDVKGYSNIPLTNDYKKLLQYVVEAKRSDGKMFVDFANCQCNPHPDVIDIIGDKIMISWDMIDRAGNLNDESLRSAEPVDTAIYCSRSWHLNHNVLLPNGEMVLCCMDYGMQRVIGNLREQSYEEIMQGDIIKSIKCENKNKGDILCRHCTYAKKLENKYGE